MGALPCGRIGAIWPAYYPLSLPIRGEFRALPER